MYKQAIAKLQEVMSKKYPEFRAKFYINRKNRLIHIGMDQCLFDFNNYRIFLWDCEWFLKKYLKKTPFKFYRIPNLICCTKWKYDCVCAIRVTNDPNNASVF